MRPRRTGGRPRRAAPAPTCSARLVEAGHGREQRIGEIRGPDTAPICAISRAAPSRSSRAASDCCKVGGIACAPPCSPRSNSRRVTSSTNSGTPPVRSLTPSTMSLGSAWWAASSPTICATATRSSGQSEITLWCERRLQGGRNSGRVVAMMSNGACAPRSARGAHQIERGRVGPVQVLEGEHGRLRSRPRENPGRHRRQLPAAQLLWREFRCAVLWQRGRRPGGASRGAYSVGSRPISRNVCSRSARRCSAGSIRAEALAAPFGDRVQGRILQELRGRPFDPGVRRLAEAARETPPSAATCPGQVRRQ